MLSMFRGMNPDTEVAINEEFAVRKTKEVFLLFAMGSQFDHLIKQQLEALGVFCLVADPVTVTADDVEKLRPVGIILSGGPMSVVSEPPPFDGAIFKLGIPVLGICLGFQMWAKHVGAIVRPGHKKEFGTHTAKFTPTGLFDGCTGHLDVLQSHGDVIEPSEIITVLATTVHSLVAAGRFGHLYGVQLHPEVTHTTGGAKIFENFCFGICGAKDRFPAQDIAKQKITELKSRLVFGRRVLLALSGGSDSSVVAYLLKNTVDEHPDQILAVYIKGIDRPDDERFVIEYFGNVPWLRLMIIDATDDFLRVLAGANSMHEKRVAMRSVYKNILQQAADDFGASFIAQGTLMTDISESGGGHVGGARKATIKLHHNINLGFSIPELTPLDDCVKDGARNIGRALDVPEALLTRHPFPGPGLVVRIEGPIDKTKLHIARAADDIFIEELRRHKLYEGVWQAGVVVTRSITTCTKGDDAAEGVVLAIWGVWSVNGFTAQWAEFPEDFKRLVSRRLTNEIKEVGAVVHRISDKPPTTIEWG